MMLTGQPVQNGGGNSFFFSSIMKHTCINAGLFNTSNDFYRMLTLSTYGIVSSPVFRVAERRGRK